MNKGLAMPTTRIEKASWLLAAAALVFVLKFHLLVTLLAGLLVYDLVHIGGNLMGKRLSGTRAKLVTVALLATLVGGGIVLAVVLAVGYFSNPDSVAALANKMAEILENSRKSLPASIIELLPDSVDGIKDTAVEWLRQHATELQGVGKDAAIAAAHVLVGVVIGAMVAMREVSDAAPVQPFAAALTERCRRLADAFRRIVFAQVRISALNTVFTGIYLMAVLPMFGVHLPLTKTMVVVTFLAGLLPVIGNLISNTVIVIVSLAHSPQAAIASLVFLVVIHKVEYFLNARIVGSQISARAWELLLAMLVMEAAFGIGGVVAAPIYYAYLKQELIDAGLV
jgi:predicted PurR-regulated permease PerM